MGLYKVLSLFVFTLFLGGISYAQQQIMSDYVYDSSVKVYDGNNQLQTIAGCGGFNNPQFGMADLNNDGLKDLVVFENGHGVRTFINEGSAGNPKYIYTPRYELNFPPINNYMVLADYNCDNIADLFERGSFGFAVHRGYYNWKNELCFTFYKNLFYTNDTWTNGAANAYCDPQGDVPAIVDVDNDGDLDFISYDVNGYFMYYYKNERVEENLPCDSIVVKLVDKCWGKVQQAYYREHKLQAECDNSSLNRETQDTNAVGKKTHVGNSPCLFDYDDDGDYDYLDGSISWNEMTFLLNGRVENGWPVDTMIAQDTMWQSNGTQVPYDVNGHQIEIPIWPAAFNVDIDQDGKKDLLIAPIAAYSSENYKCIWFYKNNTTPGHPSWTFESDTFLIDQTIDLGTAAYPTFFDYNKDGLPDLFIGSDGYYTSDGTLRSRISYYMNTSTPGNPSFKLITKDFLGLGIDSFQGIAPTMGDIDGDGKTDLLIGHADGTITYFKNLAASDNVQPQWQLTQTQLTDANANIIGADGDGGGHSAPIIYDIDTDGNADLLIGDMYGNIRYYKNMSTTPGVISLQLISDTLGGVKVDPNQVIGNFATPFIGVLDSTGNKYLLLGSNSGNMYRYSGFEGNTTTDFNLIDTQYCNIDTTDQIYTHPSAYCGIYGNFRSAPSVADITGNGTYTMVIGDIYGGVKFYTRGIEPNAVANINATNYDVHIYPNPAKNILNVTWNGLSSTATQISVYNIEGQQWQQVTIPRAEHSTQLDVRPLPPGMYICAVKINGQVSYNKFTVLK